MGWNGNIMTAPVGMGDISNAVGNSSLDLGYLVAHGSIKKWSLHKPVMLITGYDTPGDIYPDDATWLYYMQNRVRETNENVLCPFALKVASSINLYEVIGEESAPSVDWVYQQPAASGKFWRRMLDFKGYTNQPNVPINPPGDFVFYKNITNVLYIDTNDGEVGSTSIQVSMLTQLSDYKLMVAIKGPSLWYYAVMDTVISSSVNAGVIAFTLPGSLGLSAGRYDAYIVGMTSSWGGTENAWNTATDGLMRNFTSMLPLPLPSKTDCKFQFTVANTAPETEMYISYTFYINRSMVIQSIEFHASKYGAITDMNTFAMSLYNIDVRNDNDEVVQRLNDTVSMPGSIFSYDGTTRRATATKTLNVSNYGINAGDYPNLVFDSQNNRSYSVINAGTQQVIFVD